MSASRRRAAAGEVFLGEVCKSKSILPYKAICPAYQKAGQPPWVARFFDSMGVFICNISTVAFAFYWPLTTGLCQLLIANCSIQSIPPQSIPPNTQKGRYYGATPSDRARPSISKSPPHPKEIPRRRPPGILYLQYRMQLGGPVSGKVWAGEAPEGPASPGEAGPSNVVSTSRTLLLQLGVELQQPFLQLGFAAVQLGGALIVGSGLPEQLMLHLLQLGLQRGAFLP